MKQIPFGKPIIGNRERRAVDEVLQGPILVHGPRAKQFEADFATFTGAPNALAVGSCTAGLHLGYFDLGIKPGDEVIVPAQTHSATAHAVEYCGGTPVFVDCQSRTGNIELDAMEAAITPRTKAISVVHYLGLPVDMVRVCEAAKKHDLFVVEDCALSIGATLDGVHTGLMGDMGSFSFYPVKHMTTAEGGMVITKHDDLAERLGKKRAFGVDRVVGERKVPGIYDVTMLGFNYRMNEIEAALGVEQLGRMPSFLQAREENFNALAAGLSEIDELTVLASGTDGRFVSSHYCLSVVLREDLRPVRFDIVSSLKEQGIGTSVYYPRPVPHMTFYSEKYGYADDSFPHAAAISYGSIALPVGPHLDTQDMEYIAEAMKQAIQGVK